MCSVCQNHLEHISFLHSSVEGYLACVYLLAMVSHSALKLGVYNPVYFHLITNHFQRGHSETLYFYHIHSQSLGDHTFLARVSPGPF